MTFNIYHGEARSGKFDPEIFADIINAERPDLVALQEVDRKTKRIHHADLPKILAKKTQMYSTFEKAIDYAGGEYGLAILSRNKPLRSKKIKLPHGTNEARIALEIQYIMASGDTIVFINTHLDNTAEKHYRIEEVNTINALIAKNSYPAVLDGDLNDTPGSKTLKILEEYWTPAFNRNNPEKTYPYDHPKIKIDYILYRPRNFWRVVSRKVIKSELASDHLAYIVTFEFKP